MSLRTRRILRILGVVVALVSVVGGVGSWLYVRSLDRVVNRTDVFGNTPEESRPAKVADDATNYLLLGTDSAEESGGSTRADTIILAHLPANRETVQFISIPRDTWVPIPPAKVGSGDGTTAKINAAYALGGASRAVQAVEAFTGVHIDHVAVVDFVGFSKIIDALGGIDVTVDQSFTSPVYPYHEFTAGVQHMDGAVALDFARQRHPFVDGDFARMRHQRAIIAAVFNRASELSVLSGPTKVDSVIRSLASAVTVDQTMSILDMVGLLRTLSGGDLSMLTSPSSGTGMVGDQSVVFADTDAAEVLYEAVRTDTMDDYLRTHPQT
jgi:LCP family protein required for cell wall assembly